jgi:hypothetical protein
VEEVLRYIITYGERGLLPDDPETQRIIKIAKYIQYTNIVYIAQDFENLADMIMNEDKDGHKKH